MSEFPQENQQDVQINNNAITYRNGILTITHHGNPQEVTSNNNNTSENGPSNEVVNVDPESRNIPTKKSKICTSNSLTNSTPCARCNSSPAYEQREKEFLLNHERGTRSARSMVDLNLDNNNSSISNEGKFPNIPVVGIHSLDRLCNGERTKASCSINSCKSLSSKKNISLNKVAPASTEVKTIIEIGVPEPNPVINANSYDSLEEVCRICHDNPSKLVLMTPCRCKGSMRRVHLSCLERWLSESGKNSCEICGHEYNTVRKPKYTGLSALFAWVKKPLTPNDTRNLFFDIACFFILTPLAAVSSWLCINGAQQYSNDHHFYESKILDRSEPSNSTWTAIGLLSLTGTLVVAYLVWLFIAARYHTNVWKEWQLRNFMVTIVPFDESQALELQQPVIEEAQELYNVANNNIQVANTNNADFSRRTSFGTLYLSDDELVFASVYERDSLNQMLGSDANLPEIHNFMASTAPYAPNHVNASTRAISNRQTRANVLLSAIGSNSSNALRLAKTDMDSDTESTSTLSTDSEHFFL